MTKLGKHLTREDWILAALTELDRGGIQAVKVELLARILGVTKGSFYWHFESRQELLDSLLTYWSGYLTKMTSDELNRLPDDPRNRLLWLLGRIAEGKLNEHDFAVRTWAVFDPIAAEVVRQVDEERLGFLRELFLEIGFDGHEADLRSRMSYYYVIGEQVAGLDSTDESRYANLQSRHALLTKLPTDSS